MDETKKKENQTIITLIQLIDQNESKLFKLWDFFGKGKTSLFLTLASIYLFTEPVLLLATTSFVDKAIIFLTVITVLIALLTAIAQYAEENIIGVNFDRLKKDVEEDQKPLLMALIKIKSKHVSFKLEEIYSLNQGMFTKEKLLERLYE